MYHPAKGSARRIRANVGRNERTVPAQFAGNARPHPELTIEVSTDPNVGITGEELDTGKDHIELAVKVGQSPQRRPIIKRLRESPGMMLLEVK